MQPLNWLFYTHFFTYTKTLHNFEMGEFGGVPRNYLCNALSSDNDKLINGENYNSSSRSRKS